MPNTNVWFSGEPPTVVELEPRLVAARLNESAKPMVCFGGDVWVNARLVTRLDPSPTLDEIHAARLAHEAKEDAEAESERAFAYEKAEGLLPGEEGASHGD